MKRFLLIISLCVLTFTLTAQKRKEPLNIPITLNYALPKAGFIVTVDLENTKYLPGPYAFYAEKKLGMKPDYTEITNVWKIKNIDMTAVVLPDDKAVYSINAVGDYSAINLTLSPDGYLAGISAANASAYNPNISQDYLKKSIVISKDPSSVKNEKIEIYKIGTYNTLKEVLDSNFTEQEIDGVMKKIWDPIIHYELKTEQENVSEAVKAIFRIRASRNELLLSDDDKLDGKTIDVLLKEFDKLEKEYLQLFLGKKVTYKYTRSFICVPEKGGELTPVFRFSESEGITESRTATLYCVVAENAVVQGEESNDVATVAEGTTVETAPKLYYRLPAVADVKLKKANVDLIKIHTVVPQLGKLTTFPMEVISSEKLSLIFYPEYGSLKSIGR
ncbi:MAG: DUF4831 family protein [Culturomica sp.]|jgi:hypothetical protein|nr:DUF4831 family protein [Culturomica sp.]